jgi:lipopolysaccharide/colanic/teichoic acid biosynthesis glycosyltransferase
VFKRIFDIVAAILALVVLWPLLIIIGLLVAWNLRCPVFYVEKRPGFGGRPFRILKFRTMTSELTKDGEPLPDDERLTRFGSFLRASSLDELPELINVFKGDMSLDGIPAPVLEGAGATP